MVVKRAATEEEKRAVLERLLLSWKKAPLLRLGQLLCHAADKGHRLFYLDDAQLVDAVESYVRMPDPGKSSPGGTL